MEHVTKTTVGIGAAAGGPFTLIAKLIGEIKLPEEETEVTKPRGNTDAAPTLLFGDTEISDSELNMYYTDHATYLLLKAEEGKTIYMEYTLEGGDKFEYESGIKKLGPVSGADENAVTGVVALANSRLVSSTAAA